MYIGNEEQLNKLIVWLNTYLYHRPKEFYILHGDHGNGKTLMVEHLAKKFKVDLCKVTCEDVKGKDNLNSCIKQINLCNLNGFGNKKIILLDDIEEFNNNTISKILDISIYPVICTTLKYPTDTYSMKYKRLEIKRPRTSQILRILKIHQKETGIGKNLKEEQLEYIAKESPSVRSAINSLYTGIVTKHIKPHNNIPKIKKQLVQRELTQNIDRTLLRVLTKNMHCYNENTYKVFNRFCIYDFDLMVRFKESIDSFKVNNMIEPIEHIKWLYYKQKEIVKKEKQIKKEEKKQEPKKQIPTHNPIDDFF